MKMPFEEYSDQSKGLASGVMLDVATLVGSGLLNRSIDTSVSRFESSKLNVAATKLIREIINHGSVHCAISATFHPRRNFVCNESGDMTVKTYKELAKTIRDAAMRVASLTGIKPISIIGNKFKDVMKESVDGASVMHRLIDEDIPHRLLMATTNMDSWRVVTDFDKHKSFRDKSIFYEALTVSSLAAYFVGVQTLVSPHISRSFEVMLKDMLQKESDNDYITKGYPLDVLVWDARACRDSLHNTMPYKNDEPVISISAVTDYCSTYINTKHINNSSSAARELTTYKGFDRDVLAENKPELGGIDM